MHFERAHKTWLSWLACLAILMSALAPTLTHALQSRSGEAWTEICTASGTQRVRLDNSPSASPTSSSSPIQGGDHAGPHCPYCSLHTPTLIPAPVSAADARLTLTHERPLLFFSAPRPLFAWAAAQARAPPACA